MGLQTDVRQPAGLMLDEVLFQLHLSYACDNNTAVVGID